MKQIHFGDKFKQPIYLSLGFFDSIHLGHQAVINTAMQLAVENNAQTCVFTFSNNPSGSLGKPTKLVFTFEERLKRFEQLGVNNVMFCEFDAEFCTLMAQEFLQKLVDNYNILGIVVGNDYKFGNKGSGNTKLLSVFCANNNIKLNIIETLEIGGEKCSSTRIRGMLTDGDIDSVNNLLNAQYLISGKVVKCFGVGTGMGFPTANIMHDSDKQQLKSGVYSTQIDIEGQRYNAVTNVGSRPTFDDDSYKIESYILNFNGDLYGKTVEVYFRKRMRDIIKFSNKDDLAKQIAEDIRIAYND